MKNCPNRDACPCHGPVPICYHGYYGPTLGVRSDPLPGTAFPVYRVTADDCGRCGFMTPPGHPPGPTEAPNRTG